jgi:hypothetical protein
MAVDLSCYALAPPEDAEATLLSLSTSNREIFPKKFVISKVRVANSIHKEIALEYGMHAKSFFMISLNEKNAANLVLHVVDLTKGAFGEGGVIVLHGNEHLM